MNQARRTTPSRLSGALHSAKRWLLSAQHTLRTSSRAANRLAVGDPAEYPLILGQHKSALFTAENSHEQMLELGKVQNLRIACRTLDGVVVPAGELMSFWTQVGKCTKRKGYAVGRELKEGCLVPAIGGGICQLSNGLYAAGLAAGMDIVERHGHSQIVPGSAAEQGLDATVAWNYVDLKLSPKQDVLLTCSLTATELVVTIRAKSGRSSPLRPLRLAGAARAANSCATCGESECHHKAEVPTAERLGLTTFLVDESWPEFDAYVTDLAGPHTVIGIPLSPKFRKAQYAWNTDHHSRVMCATRGTLIHSLRSRSLPAQGAVRQANLLDRSRQLANWYGRRLPIEAQHVVVSLNLLPYLWEGGHLGGRSFDVFMSRQPLAAIHQILDEALSTHPDRRLLGDFRADQRLVDLEQEALAAAGQLITPHRGIAQHDPRTVYLDWKHPLPVSSSTGPRIAFPGPTVGRKGAYELRGALLGLDLDLVLAGSQLEGDEFWTGVRTMAPGESGWLESVGLVVQPAYIEDKPRKLLQALVSGRKVIATPACGLPEQENLVLVPAGDVEALRAAILEFCHQAE